MKLKKKRARAAIPVISMLVLAGTPVFAAEPCETCSGTGQVIIEIDCDACGGTGAIEELYSCPSCMGSGIVQEMCSDCGGSGSIEVETEDGYVPETCQSCGGDGFTERVCDDCGGAGSWMELVTCNSCMGSGKQNVETVCPDCQGDGFIDTPEPDPEPEPPSPSGDKILGIDADIITSMSPYLAQGVMSETLSILGVCLAFLVSAFAIKKAIRWLTQILKQA